SRPPAAPASAAAARARIRSPGARRPRRRARSEEHTSELQSRQYLVCRLLLEKKTRRCEPGLRARHPQPHELGIVDADFFFNDAATTEIYTLSLHDALPISTSSETS